MYTVLDENLMIKGRLSLNNGQGSTSFFGDTITTQLATDNANDPTNLTTNDYTNQDKQGNAKQWSHSLTISFESTDLGTSITTNDYLMYFDNVVNHYYLMKVLGSDTDRSSGYITATAINAAIYELGKQLIQTEQTLSQVDLKTFVTKMYKNAPFSLQIVDNNLTTVDYTISANTSLQALLQDLQTKFNVDVDSWVEVDNTGHITDRVLYFGNRGRDNGELIRYGGAKGFEAMTATEVSDIIYTKLYVTGKTDDKDTTKGHIGTVNNGLEYIVDDEANQKLYAIGASQQQPVYLESAITNNLLSEPQALLDWAKEQMAIFNHPRFNYTVTPLHDQNVTLGDIVTVQDFHIKPMILVNSKVIQKTTSFASPETNTFVLGEFSSIFTDNMNKGANVITLIKKDVTVVEQAAQDASNKAEIARQQADAAHDAAVQAASAAYNAQVSADGKAVILNVTNLDQLPTTAKEGTLAWYKTSNGEYLYIFLNGSWVKRIDPDMAANIANGVNKATSDAKAYADQAIATNDTNVSASIKAVDDKANKLKSDQAVFDAKAQGYANQALNDAKTNTSEAVQQTAKNATDALAQAKADLTSGIAKEATDRQNAVNALDKTAQGYANQAKSDAISAATTADGVINKKIDDTASGITATISQNKKDAEGKISTAQTTAQTAVDGLKFKVSQTDYDTKIGDLSAKINDVKETADGSKQVIADIKIADGKQDARMTKIESDASGVKTTVSDLQTAQGKQSGDISTLQQRADGFDATVTKVNNLSVGGRNLLLNSQILSWGVGNNTATSSTKVSYDSNTNMWHITSPKGGSGNAGIYFSQTNNVSYIITKGQQWAFSFDIKGSGVYSQFGIEASSPFNKLSGNVPTDWTRVSSTGTATGTNSIVIYFNSLDVALDVYIKLPKLETGNQPTDWTPAPEDLSGATAKAQLTADKAQTALDDYKTDANGRISKAQSDITQTAKDVTTKVSQTDYNAKTGDLDTRVTKAQTTADGVVTTVGNYQTSNDERVKSAESAISQNAKDIGLRVTTADFNNTKTDIANDYNYKIGQVKITADKVETTVSNASSSGFRYVRFRGEGNSDNNGTHFGHLSVYNTVGTDLIAGKTAYTIGNPTITGNGLSGATTGQYNTSYISLDNAVASEKYIAYDLGSVRYDINKIEIGMWTSTRTYYGVTAQASYDGITWTTLYKGNIDKTFLVGNSTTGQLVGTVVNIGSDNAKIASQQVTIDGITDTVSNPKTGLSVRVQTAEGTLSRVQGTDIPALQKATFWQPYSSLNFNDYQKQGSFFFNTTAAKTNGPTTSNGWIYLMVEQGTSDNTRIKQTAWYDGVTGVKVTYVRTLNAGTWSPWYANDNDSVTTISQTNANIRQEISDRKTGDNNTLQQGKDFTTSQISNSETGMKSFVNQTISGLQIGAISSDVNALKLSTQWQAVNVDNLNNMTNQGKFFIQGGNHTNAPVGGWFYLTVDKPINGRITQVAWADSNPTMQYTRILFGSNWSNWNRVVTNETVLSIFNDSWSLGTSANDGITKQLITGINGQADGTLVLSGKSVILNSDTVVGNNFIIGSANIANGAIGTAQVGEAAITSAKIANLDVSKLTGDTITGFNINANRQIYIASGGSLVSDVVNMDKNSFSVVAPNINSNRISAQGFKVDTTNGVFNIKSSAGVVSSDGKISVTYANQSSPYKNGTFHSEYGTNNLAFSATGYDNQDPDEYVNMSSAELDYMYSKTGFLSDATDHTSIRANLIETTGTLNAFSGAQIPNIYSYPNLILESKNQSVYFRSGGDYRLQIRENGYIYLWNKKFGSGGSSLQVAGDGALFVQSSATKFKEDIQYDGGTSVGDKFLTLDPATWQDKAEYEARAKYRKIGTEPGHQIHMDDKRYYGLIAEDLVKAGLEEFVVRDEKTGEVNGLEYDKVAISLIPVLREQRAAINELKVEIERLKDKVK